ncbi:MAG: SDR family oxidoreductase [Actinocatenispora sp.]
MPARTWLVTGSSTGLGRALVTELLARGERVAATARDPRTLADLSDGGRPPWTAQLDVTDHTQVREVVDRAVAELGRIDVVVSNAGYGLFGAAEEITDEQLDRQLRTNLVGPMQLARAVLPHLRAQGSGHFIQISSVGGQCTLPGMAVYHASKWGVEGFFESMAAEVHGFGIGVTIVEPGTVATNFAGSSRDSAPAMPVYTRTPAGRIRRAVDAGVLPSPGDAAKMASAIADCADQRPVPLRLALGSDSYQLIRTSLQNRLDALDQQKDVAFATDTTAS